MTANDNRARSQDDDDKQNLDDVRDVYGSLEIALEALRKAMEGRGPEHRDQFHFQIGFAVGRLGRVQARIYPARDPEFDQLNRDFMAKQKGAGDAP